MERMEVSSEGLLVPTGVLQEVTPHRQQQGRDAHDTAYEYAVKSQTHMWVVTIAHRATDSVLDAADGKPDAQPVLDADTMLGAPAVGCYVCEQVYTPQQRRRKCPGEPKEARR